MSLIEAPEMRIYPMGLRRRSKEEIVALVPEERQEEVRGELRTGEEIAVIFAKISRNPGSFEDIARGVDEEGAARFHQKWVVSVEGYGHKSVGEHAPIAIAVENVSSEDGDQVTDNRLAAYTEFSARFKGRQTATYFTPESVKQDPDLAKLWYERHQSLFAACDALTERGKNWVVTDEARSNFPRLQRGYSNEETEGQWRARLGKHAADAFKDMLPASRLTSMGVTVNATEAESMLSKLLSSPSASTREVGREMKAAALEVTPTLVKYADFSPYLASLPRRRDEIVQRFGFTVDPDAFLAGNFPSYQFRPPTIEDAILAAFLFEHPSTGSYRQIVQRLQAVCSENVKKEMFNLMLNSTVNWQDFEHGHVTSDGLTPHLLPPRALEFDGRETWAMPAMTYGIWREFKRHRMIKYVPKPLSTKWGYMLPPLAEMLDGSVDRQYHGSVAMVRAAIESMNDLFNEVVKVSPIDARYAVTRLHYRPAITQADPREFYHLLKLRTGDTAHPFIRQLMWPIVEKSVADHPALYSGLKLRGEKQRIAFP